MFIFLVGIVIGLDDQGSQIACNVGFAIEYETGFVSDFDAVSIFCMVCTKRKISFLRLKWRLGMGHKDDCHLNFKGYSGPMEAKAALTMWLHSEALEMGVLVLTMSQGVGEEVGSMSNCTTEIKVVPYGAPTFQWLIAGNTTEMQCQTRTRTACKTLRRSL